MYPHKTAYTLAILAAFAIVASIAAQTGAHNRITLSTSKTVDVQTADQAFSVWSQSGVRGRTLILFDNYPHMRGLHNYQDSPQLTQHNLIEYAIFKNIVRRIYLVVPDNSWNELLQHREKRPIRDVPGLTHGLYLSSMSGVPLIATTLSSLGQLPEDVLVYINTGVFDAGQAVELLKQKKIRSDIVIKYRGTN